MSEHRSGLKTEDRENSRCERQRRRYAAADVNNKLLINLRDLDHTIRSLYEGKGSQRRVLILLLERGDMTQRELTALMDVQPASASEVIGKLEAAGLILRQPSQSDRRTADIHLTEAGRQAAREAAEQREARHREMFSALQPEEKQTLLALLEKLSEDWEQRYRRRRKEKETKNKCGNI